MPRKIKFDRARVGLFNFLDEAEGKKKGTSIKGVMKEAKSQGVSVSFDSKVKKVIKPKRRK